MKFIIKKNNEKGVSGGVGVGDKIIDVLMINFNSYIKR